jgi:hypothetical protein
MPRQPTLIVIVAGPGMDSVRPMPTPPLPTVRCTIACPCGEGLLSRRSMLGFCATLAAVRATTFGCTPTGVPRAVAVRFTLRVIFGSARIAELPPLATRALAALVMVFATCLR